MAIGVYFTIRYRPYCTLKSPERETAMELHRKHLLSERMNKEEIQSFKSFQKATVSFSFWETILYFTILIHLISGLKWMGQSEVYWIPIICSLIVISFNMAVVGGNQYRYDRGSKETVLNKLNGHLKSLAGENLTKDEERLSKIAESNQFMLNAYWYILNFGVIIYLILDAWFILNSNLTHDL